jgi:hypothetical protein
MGALIEHVLNVSILLIDRKRSDSLGNLTDPLKFFRRDIGYSRARSFEVLAC